MQWFKGYDKLECCKQEEAYAEIVSYAFNFVDDMEEEKWNRFSKQQKNDDYSEWHYHLHF